VRISYPYNPEAIKEATAWQAPANPPPAIDPQTGSTAGKKPANPHCCVLYANGKICTESATFVRFMTAYPKTDGRPEAADAWNRLMIEGADPEHIIAAVATEPGLRKSPEERKFLPRADKWLDDKKFQSVPKPPPPAPPKPVAIPLTEAQIEERKQRRAAEEKRQARDQTRMRKQSAMFMAGGLTPLTPAQFAQIEAELDQELGESK